MHISTVSLAGMLPVMKFSWSRSSTVRRSMAAGTNSKPVLEQSIASDGERLWHIQRFGHGCPLHAAASNSKGNHSRSIILHWEGQLEGRKKGAINVLKMVWINERQLSRPTNQMNDYTQHCLAECNVNPLFLQNQSGKTALSSNTCLLLLTCLSKVAPEVPWR